MRRCRGTAAPHCCGGGDRKAWEAVVQAGHDGHGGARGEGQGAGQVAPGAVSGVASGAEQAVPNPPAIYDFLLGGKDNTQVDRAAAEGLLRALPDTRRAARSNRGFLVRAVEFMAGHGIDQFLDLGTGYPTSPNVHEVARGVRPDAGVVYVDHCPVVSAHNQAVLARYPGVGATQQDLRDPDAVLTDPDVVAVIDLDRPVGVLLVSVLHFVDPAQTAALLGRYVDAVPSGSMVAVSAACALDPDGTDAAMIRGVYAGSGTPFHFHAPEQFAALFTGLTLVPPGVVDVARWRARDEPLTQSGMSFLAGVGIKG